jgi:hypothetical protein
VGALPVEKNVTVGALFLPNCDLDHPKKYMYLTMDLLFGPLLFHYPKLFLNQGPRVNFVFGPVVICPFTRLSKLMTPFDFLAFE